ncbi:PASTA domain-containing protein [Allofournierella massiliensis]|uniref:non-specific serine/threonine protein kinase n=1 Tax=Allofournierella massiliensis TaxID=1650663 RepID=A0A4V2QA77_9FIRM|nr:PASTA domain-containing protein [Fournierella massiliensis]TCL48902.1 serine/threonine-protein kinase [Fournierella massiliensis]
MGQTILCPYCLSKVDLGRPDCPFCGKELNNMNPPGTLPFASLLAERYTIGRHQATDGEGILYEAVENTGGVRVMVKEYYPVTLSIGRDESGLVMPKEGREVLFKTTRMDFADLYRSIQRITPATGLAAVLDVVEENNTVYAVLEQVEGESLSRYLSEHSQNLDPAQARSLLQPIMEGVATMHKAGLVHRGICPDNIILSPGGAQARLCGYATLGLRTAGSELKSQLYDGYSAPEQYSAAEFEGRYTDVYGLAAVFYRLLTGQAPVPANQRRVNDSLQAARALEPEVPGYISVVLSAALRMDPGSRIQNVPELMEALTSQRAADSITPPQRQPERSAVREQHISISTRTLLTGSLLVIVVLFFLLMWSILGREAPPSVSSSAATSSSGQSTPQVLTVPNVVGLVYEDVQTDLEYTAQFRFIAVAQEYSSEYEAGTILEQSPQAGTETSEERPLISVVVSMGPELVEMPDIKGFTQDAAQQELERMHIKASFSMIDNNGEYASGCVVYTDPEAGTELDAGTTTVNVYIAKERDIPQVPDPTPVPTPSPAPTPSPSPTQTPAPSPTPPVG